MSSIMPHNGLPTQVLCVPTSTRETYLLDASAELAAILRQVDLLESIRADYVRLNSRPELVAVADANISQLRVQIAALNAQVDQGVVQ